MKFLWLAGEKSMELSIGSVATVGELTGEKVVSFGCKCTETIYSLSMTVHGELSRNNPILLTFQIKLKLSKW